MHTSDEAVCAEESILVIAACAMQKAGMDDACQQQEHEIENLRRTVQHLATIVDQSRAVVRCSSCCTLPYFLCKSPAALLLWLCSVAGTGMPSAPRQSTPNPAPVPALMLAP